LFGFPYFLYGFHGFLFVFPRKNFCLVFVRFSPRPERELENYELKSLIEQQRLKLAAQQEKIGHLTTTAASTTSRFEDATQQSLHVASSMTAHSPMRSNSTHRHR
jgi:hypothetical protein